MSKDKIPRINGFFGEDIHQNDPRVQNFKNSDYKSEQVKRFIILGYFFDFIKLHTTTKLSAKLSIL